MRPRTFRTSRSAAFSWACRSMSSVRNGTPSRFANCRPFRTDRGTQCGHQWARTTVRRRGRAVGLPSVMPSVTPPPHFSGWVPRLAPPLQPPRLERVRCHLVYRVGSVLPRRIVSWAVSGLPLWERLWEGQRASGEDTLSWRGPMSFAADLAGRSQPQKEGRTLHSHP